MAKIVIGKLEIEKKSENSFSLISLIVRENSEKNGGVDDFLLRFNYNVDKQYIESDVADSVLVAILPYAMEYGYDTIETIDPITSELFYHLTVNVIPVLTKNKKYFHNVKIEANGGIIEYKSDTKPTKIATGCSCGVDSFYTILSNLKSEANNITSDVSLTDLVLINSGACSWEGGETSKKWFDIELRRAERVANELKLGLIAIDTNLMEFYKCSHEHSNFMRMIGTLLGIRKLIKRYYIASGYTLDLFSFGDDDGTYQYFLTDELSNSNNKFITSALYENRYEKTKYISTYEVARDNLSVCWNGGNNCGKCEKCLRTLGAIDALNRLDDYSNAFDIEQYKNKRVKNIGLMLLNKNKHPGDYTFLKDIKKNDSKIYKKAEIYFWLKLKPYDCVKKMAKAIIKKDSKLYRKLKGINK